MDKYEEFVNVYKGEIELRTKLYVSYGRGFLITYLDKELTNTFAQFNLTRINEYWALNAALLNYIIDTLNFMKAGIIIKGNS